MLTEAKVAIASSIIAGVGLVGGEVINQYTDMKLQQAEVQTLSENFKEMQSDIKGIDSTLSENQKLLYLIKGKIERKT